MSPNLAESDIFVLLSKRRRRLTLRVLQESKTPLPVTVLAQRVRSRDPEISCDEDDAVHLLLYHTDLPKFEETGVLTHDRKNELVHPGVNFDAIIRVLDGTTGEDLPWAD